MPTHKNCTKRKAQLWKSILQGEKKMVNLKTQHEYKNKKFPEKYSKTPALQNTLISTSLI